MALGYAQSTIASNYFAGTTQTLDIWNLGASYDFDVVKLFGEYWNNKLKRDSSSGFVNGVILFSDPKAYKWILGYVHNLSKRTALYATVARRQQQERRGPGSGWPPNYFQATAATGALTPKSSTGYESGIRHAF
jgi:predicted porin